MGLAYMKFKGTYRHGLDAKNRLFIPAKYREPLGSNFVMCRAPQPLIGLYVFPEETWDELCDELNQKNSLGELTDEQEWERRDLYRYSEDVTMDKQGRVLIPQSLRDYAGISTGEVAIIGVSNRAEIWNVERWEAANAELTGESIAEAMDELGF